MPTIAFYISGHGFGHASREIEIINALFARRPDLRILVRTDAPRWLFDRTVKAGVGAGAPVLGRASCELHPMQADTGMVQIDSLQIDTDESVRRARAFMQDFDARAEAEARFLREQDVGLVVADIPPLGIAAAHRAAIPGVGISNFTWDWIYSGYDAAGDVVEAIARAYTTADLALRLPMHGGFASFGTVVDLPFVARRATRPRPETRRILGLPEDERLVLLSFGVYGLERLDRPARERLESLEGYAALVSAAPGAPLPPDWPVGRRGGLVPFDESRMYALRIRYEDLVGAVDVVVTKPGYGIISECVANRTALLYTSRGDFIEYDVLVAAMPRFLRSAFIGHDDLFAGRWAPHLDALIRQPEPPERPGTNGADAAAERLLSLI